MSSRGLVGDSSRQVRYRGRAHMCMVLQGAAWDVREQELVNLAGKDLYSALPPLQVVAVERSPVELMQDLQAKVSAAARGEKGRVGGVEGSLGAC